MAVPEPTLSLAEFKARLAREGLVVPEARIEEVYAALGHVQALAARVHRRFAYGDEPASTFEAGEAER
jgi:hypothetical protein